MTTEASVEYWRKQYESWRQSFLTRRAYCDKHGLSFALFRQCRTRLSASSVITLCQPGTRRPDFKSVVMTNLAKVPVSDTPYSPAKEHTEIALSLPGGVHLTHRGHA